LKNQNKKKSLSKSNLLTGDRKTLPKIKVITDSTSDIPEELVKKYDIDVVPLNIFFGEERYKDGINITAKEVYERLKTQKNPWPKTSQPSAREFLEYYNRAFDQGYETVFSIHISSNLSGTLNSVNLAKQMLPDKDIIAIDSISVTHPLGLLACEVAKLVKEDKSRDEILNIIENRFRNNNHICGIVDTLEYLHRGGRIGRAKKLLGNLLNMKPVLEVADGLVTSFGKTKGFDEGFNNMVRMASKIFEKCFTEEIWLGFAGDNEYTQKYYKAIKELPNAPKEIRVVEIGPTVGVHLGPGVMTISWIGDWNNKWFFEK